MSSSLGKKLSGKKITRKQAMKGLGDPSTWDAYKKALEKEFKKKPNGA